MKEFLKNKWTFFYLILQPISTALEVGLSYVLMIAIDYATGGNLEKVHLYVFGFLGYLLLKFLVDIPTRYVNARAASTITFSLREKLVQNILKMDISDFAQKNSASYVSYLTNHVDSIEIKFTWKLFLLYPDLLQFVISVVLIFVLDWRLASFVLAVSLLQLLVPKIFVKPTSDAEKKSVDAKEEYTIAIKEMFEAFDCIKSYNIKDKMQERHKNKNRNVAYADRHETFMFDVLGVVGDILSNITYVGIFLLGAVFVLLGFFKVSVIIAASQLVVFIVYPLTNLTKNITALVATKKILQDLEHILHKKEKQKHYVEKKSFTEKITISNLNFAYPKDDEDDENSEDALVLQNINLEIKKGEKVLIVGESGSGKSTLLSLLYKKFSTYTGEIKIDNVDINAISDTDYFNLVSVVHQSPFVFDDTIKNNIVLYNDTISDDCLNNAIDDAVLRKFIDGLLKKENTMIGEAASKISGGEKQRIAIARTLITNTPILLIDESTSQLDNETSRKIENMILSDKNKTCIIISHHVSAELKEQVDKIIQVENHRITMVK